MATLLFDFSTERIYLYFSDGPLPVSLSHLNDGRKLRGFLIPLENVQAEIENARIHHDVEVEVVT